MALAQERFIWPDWMPKPQVSGYGIQPVDRRTKTEMEVGGVYRAEFDTDENECSCSLVLNHDESSWFEAFERDLLKQGSVWFEMPLWVGGAVEQHIVRMKDRPKAGSLIGLHTTYTLSLDVKKRDLMSSDEAEALLWYKPYELRLYDSMLQHVMHVQMPEFTRLYFPLFPEINFDTECLNISGECANEQ